MLSEQRLALIGDPATLIERIGWARDFYGVNYLLLEVGQGGLLHAEVVASLQRFASDVMPHFDR
jgi:hypothetical protein